MREDAIIRAGLLARANILYLLAQRGESFGQFCLAVGHSAGDLKGFIERGEPAKLGQNVASVLARHFGVGEEHFGSNPPLSSPTASPCPMLVRRVSPQTINGVPPQAL